jgi:pimeloyl-ACP methyl ester carboxylesterase
VKSALHHLPSGAAVLAELPDGPPGAELAHRTPLLLLHGVGGAAFSWAPQRAHLQRERAVFTWEGRGHGQAARVADAGLADFFEDALEALAFVRAQTERPVLVAGHSMGGLLALALACERPADVCGLFLVDPVYAESGALPVRLPRPLLWLLRAFFSAVARSLLRDGWLGQLLARPLFHAAFHDGAARRAAWAEQRKQVPLEYQRMVIEAIDGVRGFPFQPFASRVAVPVHVVEALRRPGAASRFTALHQKLAANLGARATRARIPGGHYLQLDRPAEVCAELAAFAARLDAPSR